MCRLLPVYLYATPQAQVLRIVTVVMKSHVALVTGATSGIGLGIAKKLSSLGCTVILHGRKRELLQKLEKDIHEEYNHPVSHVCADLMKREEMEHMFASIKEKYPDGVDILINNAGSTFSNTTICTTTEDWERTISLMLTVPFLISRQYLPDMTRKGWGRIINVSSVLGLKGATSSAAYVSAKHGIQGLTKVIALEHAVNGVTCNAVCPGFTETPLFSTICEDMSQQENCTPEQAQESLLAMHPQKEVVSVDSVAELVVFLCSDAGRQMTGVGIPVDCGYSAT